MASKIKVDQLETVDGTGNITVNQPLSGSGAGLTSLPAANLTGSLPAISGASLTSIPAANITGTLPAISGANLTGILPAVGTSGNLLTSTGSAWASSTPAASGFTLHSAGVTVTSSIVYVDFSNIPSTVNEIVIITKALAIANNFLRVQLGTSSGLATGGYYSQRQRWEGSAKQDGAATNGFIIDMDGSAVVTGLFTLRRINSGTHSWVYAGHGVTQDAYKGQSVFGWITLNSSLTTLRFQDDAGGNFSSGELNIQYL